MGDDATLTPPVVGSFGGVDARAAVDEALGTLAADALGETEPTVRDAIRYALAGEGKRLRALLFLSAYAAAGGRGDATTLAAAVEVVHAYSLVHDDLPCMDDDDVRRGRPTVHRVFGVHVATVAGVAMVPLAARTVLLGARALELPPAVAGRILRELMRSAGAGGMIGGQLLDLEGEGRPLGLEELERVHRGKTGALIAAAARLGAVAAGAPEPQVHALDRYGAAIGLAFQIADDVLDVTATTQELGKTSGRDAALGKSTYPALLGVAAARARAQALVDDACRALDEVGLASPALADLARYSVARRF